MAWCPQATYQVVDQVIQQGFIMRTPRGRMATRKAYQHCGLKPPQPAREALELFDDAPGADPSP